MAEMACVGEIVPGPPITTVDEQYDWVRPATARQPNINKLGRIRPVKQALIRGSRFCGEQVFTPHAKAV
jgi:hypothetical protein